MSLLSRFFSFVFGLVFVALSLLVFPAGALAATALQVNEVGAPSALPVSNHGFDGLFIYCSDSGFIANQSYDSRLVYTVNTTGPYSQPTTDFDFEDYRYTGGDICDVFSSLIGVTADGGFIVPDDTIAWWQAGIDFLKVSISLGAKIYPVILGIRVISMIAYS